MRKPTVSDVNKVTCPECDTPNQAQAAFCENCGFRLRRPGTRREAYKGGPRARPARATMPLPDTQPEREPARDLDTKPEGVPAIKRSDTPMLPVVKTEPEGVLAVPNNPSLTILEGLEPITFAESNDEELPAILESSISLGAPGEESGVSMLVWVSLWLVTTGAAMLVTYYLTQNGQAHTVEVRASQRSVAVAAGPFLQGLDEQVRGFILMTCHKIATDTSECEQDRLLKGEYPQQKVELAAFKIDALEVTWAEYETCVDAQKCDAIDTKNCKVYTSQGLQVGMRVPKVLEAPNLPVVCVTRDEAQAYCLFKGGELPSHNQWEKAARGDEAALFPWGEAWISDVANWGEIDILQNSVAGKLDGAEWSAAPGSYSAGASPYKLEDAAGNVWEWVQEDDQELGHVRGGSWSSSPFDLRATGRQELVPTKRRADVGFRCAYSD